MSSPRIYEAIKDGRQNKRRTRDFLAHFFLFINERQTKFLFNGVHIDKNMFGHETGITSLNYDAQTDKVSLFFIS